MAKKKYWVALAEHGAFTKDDRYVLHILFDGQSGSKGFGMTPKFIEAEDLESARGQLHAFIDAQINHELHMLKLDAIGEKAKKKREEYLASPKVQDSDVTSLSIGEFVNEAPKKPAGDSDMLLDLDKLV